MSAQQPPVVVGRYLLHRKIARGGMASIHIARLLGDVGFSRIVAAKRMHPELAEDAEFVAMFLDEARIASRVQHRNVVSVLDVVTLGEEVMLVQEYVHGVPLGVLQRNIYDTRAHVPVPVAAAIACQILAGLHAAHETADELGTPLQIVHRDVSPQNILIAVDGTARLLDFGVAKAAMSAHVTRKGTFKGKLGYSSPEQIRGEAQRQSDIYSLAVVLWELIVGHRLHATAQSDAQLIAEIMDGNTPLITEAVAADVVADGMRPTGGSADRPATDVARSVIGAYRWSQLEAIEPVIRKALDTSPRRRWQTAAEMEEAIAAVVPLAPPADVAAWLRAVGRDFLDERERVIAEEEASWRRNAHLFVRPEAAVGIPLDAPITTATEPDGEPRMPAVSLAGRLPNAFIATLIIMLVAMVMFLDRDLDSAASPDHPGSGASERATADHAAGSAHRRASAEPSRPASAEPNRAASAVLPAPASAAPRTPPPGLTAVEADEPLRDDPPPPHAEPPIPAPQPQQPKAIARTRIWRPAPPRPAPPAHTAAPSPAKAATAALDCATPFYFEGRKKIFKPGCL